jgi:hypothetical protein
MYISSRQGSDINSTLPDTIGYFQHLYGHASTTPHILLDLNFWLKEKNKNKTRKSQYSSLPIMQTKQHCIYVSEICTMSLTKVSK